MKNQSMTLLCIDETKSDILESRSSDMGSKNLTNVIINNNNQQTYFDYYIVATVIKAMMIFTFILIWRR